MFGGILQMFNYVARVRAMNDKFDDWLPKRKAGEITYNKVCWCTYMMAETNKGGSGKTWPIRFAYGFCPYNSVAACERQCQTPGAAAAASKAAHATVALLKSHPMGVAITSFMLDPDDISYESAECR